MSQQPIFDCVVVGGGAAGLSAALTLGRSRRRVLVLDDEQPVNAKARHTQGLFTRDGASPLEVRNAALADLTSYDVQVVSARATGASVVGDQFEIQTDGQGYRTKRVLLATGVRYEFPDLPGLQETWGVGSANCPYCHGWEWRDRHLGVLSVKPESAVHQVELVQQWTDEVTLFSNGAAIADDWAENECIKLKQGCVKAVEFDTNKEVTGIVTDDGVTTPIGGLFVAADTTCNDDLMRQLGIRMKSGWPMVDDTGRTSLPQVWSAGICADPTANLLVSAALGFKAATTINASLI